jgi:hypothetical protein
MTDKMNESKLDTKLLQDNQPKTITEKKLLFTDYSIERFSADFIGPKGRKVRAYKSFEGKNAPKGLRLCQFEKTKAKYFILQFWYDGKSHQLTLGEFYNNKFGTKEALDEYNKIYQTHTNDKGIWIKNPKQTLKDQGNKVYEAEAIKLQKKSIREVIEDIVEDNYPSIIQAGRLVASSQKSFGLPMYGYNKRTLLMYYSNDKKGHGKINYKGNKFYGIAQPENSKDLFKKFPSGTGIITQKRLGKYKNRSEEISLYDHDLSKHLIEHLKAQHIRDYINEKDRSYSQKRTIKRVFTYILQYSIEKGYIPGDKLLPTKNIKIKKPEVITSKAAAYNNKRFTNKQLEDIWNNAVEKQQDKYPFSSMAICFYLVTGVRPENYLKIQKEYIKKDFIELPSSVVKTRKDQKVAITKPVQWVLDNIEETLKKPKYQKYKFVPWLFPSTKTKSKELYDHEYAATDGTRLKDFRGCWNAIMKDLGIEGAPKMIRKSFISVSKIVLKDTFKVMFITGHTKEATIDIHYNKSTDEQQKEYANEVADKVFNFVK